MKKLYKLYPTFIAATSFLPLIAAAQQDIDVTFRRITTTLNLIIGVLFVIATVVFLWGVIQFIASAGDEKKRTDAKSIMTWGVVGLAVMAAAWGIVNILIQYFGVQKGVGPQLPPFIGPVN